MRNAVMFLLAAAVTGLFVGGFLAVIEELQRDREFIAYVYGPAPADPDAVPPAEVSALLEEARRITREAGGERGLG